MIIELTTTKEDRDKIIDIWERSVRVTHTFLKESDIEYYKNLIESKFLYLVDLYGYYDEDEDKHKLVGFIGLSPQNIQDDDNRSIEMLFIDPDRIGTGVGKKLIEFAIKQRGCTLVDVNEQNQKALSFYKHFNFQIINRSELDGSGKPYPILHLKLNK
eukprot:gene8533-10488_t